jgi:hypothetical protein
MKVATPIGRVLLRLIVSTFAGLCTFPLFVTALHPYDGIIVGYRHSTSLEKCLGLGLVLVVFAGIYAQMRVRKWPTIGPGVNGDRSF